MNSYLFDSLVLSISGVAGITLSGAFKGWMGRK